MEVQYIQILYHDCLFSQFLICIYLYCTVFVFGQLSTLQGHRCGSFIKGRKQDSTICLTFDPLSHVRYNQEKVNKRVFAQRRNL